MNEVYLKRLGKQKEELKQALDKIESLEKKVELKDLGKRNQTVLFNKAVEEVQEVRQKLQETREAAIEYQEYLEGRIEAYKRAERQAHKAIRRKNKIIRQHRGRWSALKELIEASLP